ncbi:MAG TPA: LamG-like jellyroll fold domain-containing protein [Stenomitos sp.]
MKRDRRHAWLILALALLSGCQPALAPTGPAAIQSPVQEPRQLWGRVTGGYGTQALATDLMPYATVTLLDATNAVVATGLTDASGAFGLNPFVTWTPGVNAVYALDAVKSFDSSSDRAVLRLRTLVSWDGTKWKSLSGTTQSVSGGAGVLLTARTTALAAIKDLRAVSASALLGTLDPGSGAFTPTAGVTTGEVDTVAGLVTQALAANLDPMRWVTYAASSGTYRLGLGAKSGNMTFDLEDALAIGANSGTGATLVAGRDGGKALAFSSSTVLFDTALGGYGGAPGQFINTTGVACDRFGNVYATDRNNNRLQKFTPDLHYIWSLASVGSGVGTFSNPHSIDLDGTGAMLLSDYSNGRILKLDAYGNLLFGIGDGSSGWTTAPAPATGGAFNQLNAAHVARFDPAGNIWVSDYMNNRMLKYDPNGNFLLGIGNGQVWTTSAGNQTASGSVNASFNGPLGFNFTPTGDVYVCDRLNHRIQRFDSSGTYKGQWGSYGSGAGQLNGPEDIAIDNAGNLWVSEYYGQRVQKFDPNGNYLAQFGSQGNGPGQFQTPRFVTIGPDGGLFVADQSNHRIQKFVPTNPAMAFPVAGNLKTSTGTVEYWFKPLTEGMDLANRVLFAVDNGTTLRLVTRFGDMVTSGMYLGAYDVAGDESRTRRTGMSGADSLRLIKKGQWNHVAATWVASTADLHFYLNGVEYRTYSTGATASFNFGTQNQFIVGADWDGVSGSANSAVDQFRLYDYAKSADEIARDAKGFVQE